MRPSIEHLTSAFRDHQATRQVPAWLAQMQDDSWLRFEAQGLPWRKDEHWKYTSLYDLAKIPFVLPQVASNDSTMASSGQWVYNSSEAVQVLLHNGQLLCGDAAEALPDGLTINVVRDSDATVTHKHLELAVARPSAMLDLNHAFANHVIEIVVADNASFDKPVYLMHYSSGASVLNSPRVHLSMGKNSHLSLVEHFRGSADQCATNSRLSVLQAENSQLQHVKLQNDGYNNTHLANTNVKVGANSRYVSLVVDLGASLARNDLGIQLNGAGAECVMNGVFLPGAKQHYDHHTFVQHNQPNTNSTQLYRGVIGHQGHGVFNGKVLVQPDAQKINAQQSNHNILLADQAEIDTKPELEIYADDVKCSHGATVGQLDETSLFYLQSRGIDRALARRLLIRGFVREVYSATPCPVLHQYLGDHIAAKLESLVEQSA